MIKNNQLKFAPDQIGRSLIEYEAIVFVERAIIEGSGGPENIPVSMAGLRFIRHLLSLLPDNQYAVLPNFKNIETIKSLARLFIDSCGSINQALQNMQTIMAASSDVVVSSRDVGSASLAPTDDWQ